MNTVHVVISTWKLRITKEEKNTLIKNMRSPWPGEIA